MKHSTRFAYLFTVLFLMIAGCNYASRKGQDAVAPDTPIEATGVDWNSVNQKVFIPYCVSCHGTSGGVSVESYEAVKQNLSRVQSEALVDKSMPPSGPLPQDVQNLLEAWIVSGAPRSITATPTPTPGASPTPSPTATPTPSATPKPTATPSGILPTFASLKQNVFSPRCVSCHGANYANQAYLTNPKNGLIVAGKPASSLIYKKISAGTMPPRKPLSSVEVNAIKTWIQNGAKD